MFLYLYILQSASVHDSRKPLPPEPQLARMYMWPERNLMPSAISDVVPPWLHFVLQLPEQVVWNSCPATLASSELH